MKPFPCQRQRAETFGTRFAYRTDHLSTHLMERVMEKDYEKKESFLPIFLVISGFLLFAVSVIVQIAFISS